MRSASSSGFAAACCAALLIAQVSVAGPPRSSLTVGAKVVSPCSVRSTDNATSGGDRSVVISCAETRKAEIQMQFSEKAVGTQTSSGDALVVDDKVNNLRVVEVFF